MDHTNNNKSKNEKILTINKFEDNCNSKQFKTFTKNLFNISNAKMPGIPANLVPPPATANPSNARFKNESIDFSNKEHLKEFFTNKQKVNSRLNSMYKHSISNMNEINLNNSVGQRVLIKNTRGNNVEDRLSNTTKVFF